MRDLLASFDAQLWILWLGVAFVALVGVLGPLVVLCAGRVKRMGHQ